MPLSAEQTKTITRKLKQWLDNDRQIVTFRQVSREVGCHVDIAKNVLLEHARLNPSLEITYLLSGPLLSTSSLAYTQLPSEGIQLDAKALAQLEASQRIKIVDMDEVSDGERNSEDGTEGDDELVGNDKGGEGGIAGNGADFLQPEADTILKPEETPRWGVVMTQQAQLETKWGLFEPAGLNIHIYALSPAPITDPAQYLVPNTLLRQYPKYNDVKYGGISGDLPTEGSGSGSGSGSKALKDGGMNFGSGPVVSGKKAEVPIKKEVDVKAKGKAAPVVATKVTKEEEVKKEVKPAVKGKETKEEAVAEAPVKATAKSKAEPAATSKASTSTAKKSSQPSQSRSKKRIITSDDESEPGSNPATDTAEPPALSPPTAAKKALTSSMVRASDDAAMLAMMDMDMSEEEEEVETVEKKAPKAKPAPKAKAAEKKAGDKKGEASGSGRKRRVVKKSKTEIDEKGYMVTRDYTSEESYSGDSDAEPSKSRTAAKPRKSATSTSSASLANKNTSSQQSRASSVSTDINDEKDTKKGGSTGPAGSSSSVGTVKPKAPAPPPKNVPGKAGKPKGQSTLAGFFTKK